MQVELYREHTIIKSQPQLDPQLQLLSGFKHNPTRQQRRRIKGVLNKDELSLFAQLPVSVVERERKRVSLFEVICA